MKILPGLAITVLSRNEGANSCFCSRSDAFDLILMDIQMPEMEGYEATGEIPRQGYHDIPIIAMTSFAMKEDKEKSLNTGMNDYISTSPSMVRVFSPSLKNGYLIVRNSAAQGSCMFSSTDYAQRNGA